MTRIVEIGPRASVTMDRDVVMVPNGTPQHIRVKVAAGITNMVGRVHLEAPAGWNVDPQEHPVEIAARGEEKTLQFTIKPPPLGGKPARVRAVVTVGDQSESWRVRTVAHEHLPVLTVRQPSEALLVPFALRTRIHHVGYIPGPGDRVAESLAAVGYHVTQITEERLSTEPLDAFEAIVVGVRAFNSNAKLANHRERLLNYVEQGGRLVVQYNTNSRLGPLHVPLGPYPMEIGRDRVSDERAPIMPTDPHDPVVTTPNVLVPADFEGWVQERGLYFASKWDDRYRAVFSMADPGSEPLHGALLVARHGKGVFVYTGLAFFRQLPAGVAGAYRLFANILAL
jgi:hypothetical protein